MTFAELAEKRYSVRKFTDKHLEPDVIEKILKVGHLAPTGCNNQPQRILVMNTDESIAKLRNCTISHFNAPTAMLICYNKDEVWTRKYDGKTCGVADACIVTTHMMLAATELGVGTTWVMHFDPFAMREAFAIPENVEPVALLIMGYPAPDAEPLHLHNEFRPMDEVVIFDTFNK
jgi:nitroreductase